MREASRERASIAALVGAALAGVVEAWPAEVEVENRFPFPYSLPEVGRMYLQLVADRDNCRGRGFVSSLADITNLVTNIEAVAEALLFAAKAGADPARVRQALMGGFASSKILEVHGERMIKRTFDPGFRIELHQKDLNLALSSARELGVALPNTATAQELFNSCAAHGGKAWDHSAMVRALEKMSNFEIGQKAA